MCPVPETDEHDAPWLGDELVPSEAAVVEDVLVGSEYLVGQPVVAHELPEVLSGIELEAFGRQCRQRDVGGNSEPRRHMPASLIEEQHGVAAGCHFGRDFRKVLFIAWMLQAGKTSAAPFPS